MCERLDIEKYLEKMSEQNKKEKMIVELTREQALYIVQALKDRFMECNIPPACVLEMFEIFIKAA